MNKNEPITPDTQQTSQQVDSGNTTQSDMINLPDTLNSFIQTERKIREIENLKKISEHLNKISQKISRYIILLDNKEINKKDEIDFLQNISILFSELSNIISDFLEIAYNLDLDEIIAFKENIILPIINKIEI